MRLANAASTEDYRTLAKCRLPRVLFDYIDGGSYSETTLRRNTADLAALPLRQCVMRDMSRIDPRVTLFGEMLPLPLILGPVGFAGMYARRGEVQAARAAKTANLPFCLSTVGICSVEEVAAVGGSLWFQLYMIKDRTFMRALLLRAWASGCRILVLTVDLPTPGTRYRDVRSGMAAKLDLHGSTRRAIDGLLHPRWLMDVYLRGRPHRFGNLAEALPNAHDFADAWAWIRANFDETVTWKALDFVREAWPGKVVVKGIMEVEDARLAAAAGVDGIVVSNHGGRQLDSVRSSIAVLPGIAEAVGDAVTVLADGGIRSGLDVLKVVASGAKAVLLGRAWAYALAAGGELAVIKMLCSMENELRTAMILAGCVSLTDGAYLSLEGSDKPTAPQRPGNATSRERW